MNSEKVTKKLNLASFKSYLKKRPRDSHKGDFGKVLIIGGSPGFAGAIILAGIAALRVGAGLVSIATHPQHASFDHIAYPELMCHAIHSKDDLKELFNQATFVVIGPGLGLTSWGQDLLQYVLTEKNKPLLLDADALNGLAQMNAITQRQNWILTPHPGEAARLLKMTTENVQKNRPLALKKLHDLFGGTILLKGSDTLVVSNQTPPEICKAGNPGMATAGMGDVLSGTIGGLAAQHIPLHDAARLGVLIHAMAGDLAAKKGERGMIASDLIAYLKQLVN